MCPECGGNEIIAQVEIEFRPEGDHEQNLGKCAKCGHVGPAEEFDGE